MRAWYTITIRMGVNNLPHTLPHVISLTEMGTVIEGREDCELKKVRIAGVRFRIDDGISATRGRRKAPHYCWCLFEHQIAGERGGTRGNCPTILSCISQYLNPQTGSTPFPRTVELSVAPPVAADRVSAAAGDCASVRYS